MTYSYEDQHTIYIKVLWPSQILPVPLSTRAMRAMLHPTTKSQLIVTRPSRSSQPRPMQKSKQRSILHMGIIPIPPPPRPPRNPPRLAGPPPKLLPLLLLLVDLLFVTPTGALPLLVLPDAFLFFFHPPRPRPLLPPRLLELSEYCSRAGGGAGAS